MKIATYLCSFSIAMLSASSALASTGISGESLGKLQSTLDFCARGNPQATLEYRSLAMQRLHGANAGAVARARNTEEYREAYKAKRAEFADVAKEDVAAACERMLTALD